MRRALKIQRRNARIIGNMTTNEGKVFIIHVAKEAESEWFPKNNFIPPTSHVLKAINPLLLSFVTCAGRHWELNTQIVCFEPICDGAVYFDM